jgi:hypothetical protein
MVGPTEEAGKLRQLSRALAIRARGVVLGGRHHVTLPVAGGVVPGAGCATGPPPGLMAPLCGLWHAGSLAFAALGVLDHPPSTSSSGGQGPGSGSWEGKEVMWWWGTSVNGDGKDQREEEQEEEREEKDGRAAASRVCRRGVRPAVAARFGVRLKPGRAMSSCDVSAM